MQLVHLIESAILAGEISEHEVFDTNYLPVPGTQPTQWTTRFCWFADKYIQRLTDEMTNSDPRFAACGLSDLKGYHPTHLSRFSRAQGPDPVWNDYHCRNRRFHGADRSSAEARRSEDETTLITYRMKFGSGAYLTLKDVFVPTYILGRRWGSFDLVYSDEPVSFPEFGS